MPVTAPTAPEVDAPASPPAPPSAPVDPNASIPVANVTKEILVLSVADGESIEWQYQGHPDGDDIQELSPTQFRSVRVQRAIRRGILSETTVEALHVAGERQREARIEAHNERMDELAKTLDTATPNQTLVISADQIEARIESRDPSAPKDADLVETATQEAEQRAAASEAALQQATQPSGVNPMDAINGV